MNYIDLIHIKKQYNDTSQEIIKGNIKRLMDENKTKYKDIRKILTISEHTAYSYTNPSNNNKPEIYNLLILSKYWKVDIDEFFKVP